jgi:hypothetical protein
MWRKELYIFLKMKFKKHDLITGIEFDKRVLKEFGVIKSSGKYYCKNCNQYFKTKPKLVCEAKIEDKKSMGKHSRAAGKRFELKVREDLEKQGWIVCRWSNNIEFEELPDETGIPFTQGELIPAKHIFNPYTKAMSAGNGFPDFIAFRLHTCGNCFAHHFGPCGFEVILIESKMIGVLDKKEKEKIEWIKNNLKISVVIAKQGKKRGEIEYVKM